MNFNMFEIMFGWRKASTCKKLIRNVQCRLKLLKNKRESIIRQLREVIIQLIKNGQDHSAFARVEQLIKDQRLKDVYDLLENFGELIIIRLAYIRRHRDCPDDISEAISSLLFASAWCGDLPELNKLRKLFQKRYGDKFVMAAVELLDGNHVHPQMIEKICIKTVSDDVKFRLLKEMARESNLQLSPPDIGGTLLLQYPQAHDFSSGTYALEWEETRYDSSPRKCSEGNSNQSYDWSDDNTNIARALTVVPAPYIVPFSPPLDDESLVRVENHTNSDHSTVSRDKSFVQRTLKSCGSRNPCAGAFLHKVDEVTGASLDSPSQILVRSFVYLDDIEEFQPCKEDGNGESQRGFTFKITMQPLRVDSEASRESLPDLNYAKHGEVRNTLQWETSDGKTSSITPKKQKKSTKKSLRRGYGFVENQVHNSSMSMTSRKDIECALYYGEAGENLPNGNLMIDTPCRGRKHQENKSLGKYQSSSCRKKLLSSLQPYHPQKAANKRDDMESPLLVKNRITTLKELPCCNYEHDHGHCLCSQHEDYRNAVVVDDILQKEVDVSSCGSFSTAMLEWTPKDVQSSSLNSQSLISLHSQSTPSDGCQLSVGKNSPSTWHIHPKLPDYDDIVSKFKALKMQRLQRSISAVSNIALDSALLVGYVNLAFSISCHTLELSVKEENFETS